MNEKIIEQLEQQDVIVKKSTIHNRLGPPGELYIQIIVNDVELPELACPHFTDERVIQKWCQRHPEQKSHYSIKEDEQENKTRNPVKRPVRQSDGYNSTVVGVIE